MIARRIEFADVRVARAQGPAQNSAIERMGLQRRYGQR